MRLNTRERKALRELRDGQPHSSRWIATRIKMHGHFGKVCVMMKFLAKGGLVANGGLPQVWMITPKGNEYVE